MMEFLTEYNLTGLVIGVATFLIIGLFHPFVIKGEYYFGVRCWWFFLLMGVAAIAASVAVRHILWSTLLAVWGASSLWSIGELFEQRGRVAKGCSRPIRTGRRNNPAVAPACRRAGPERQSARRGGSPAGRESPSGAEWSGLRPRFSAV